MADSKRPNGFGRARRLTTAADYQRVFKKAQRVSDSRFTVLARRVTVARGGPDVSSNPRLGLAISKKNVRLAVDRNRIKRLIRESFRTRNAGLDGLDIVVLARSGVHRADNRQILQSLEQLWSDLARRAHRDQR